jgi:hypothetical protein
MAHRRSSRSATGRADRPRTAGGQGCASVLVVVVAVDRMQVFPVAIVGVTGMRRELVTTGRPVDMHVAAVRQMHLGSRRRPFIDVVAIGMVEMAIVEEVEMVLVGDLRVPAPAVVQVGVRRMSVVGQIGGPGRVVGHGPRHGGTTRPRAHGTVTAGRRSGAVARCSTWAAR